MWVNLFILTQGKGGMKMELTEATKFFLTTKG
jgi:hypothetical protein